ncbi:MAG: thiamine phosphate synthase [Magnetococcales bacterium]|nr:thiamine phosphate synthase [Magnetococcales bacterium]
MPQSPPHLLIITESPLREDLEPLLARALTGAPFDLLLRDKGAAANRLIALGRRLKPLLHAAGGRLLIHDRADIARLVEADGLHLPENGMSTREARQLLGTEVLLGRSCHEPENAREHLLQGGDYVTLSPVFITGSHPEAIPLGVVRFSQWRARIPGAVLALGGIHEGNVRTVLDAGATGVALIRGLFTADDPASAARKLSAPFLNA